MLYYLSYDLDTAELSPLLDMHMVLSVPYFYNFAVHRDRRCSVVLQFFDKHFLYFIVYYLTFKLGFSWLITAQVGVSSYIPTPCLLPRIRLLGRSFLLVSFIAHHVWSCLITQIASFWSVQIISGMVRRDTNQPGNVTKTNTLSC